MYKYSSFLRLLIQLGRERILLNISLFKYMYKIIIIYVSLLFFYFIFFYKILFNHYYLIH